MKKKKTSVLALASRTRCDDAGSEAENQHLINVMVQAGQSIRRAVSGFGAVRGWARARGLAAATCQARDALLRASALACD